MVISIQMLFESFPLIFLFDGQIGLFIRLNIQVSDSLNPHKIGKEIPKVKIVLANPPFGKSNSDIPTVDENLSKKDGYFLRKDFWVTISSWRFYNTLFPCLTLTEKPLLF